MLNSSGGCRYRGLSNRRGFVSTNDIPGVCDGITVEVEGRVWTAELISGEHVRRTPDGEEQRRIGMPVRDITSVMFGGDDLDEFHATSMARVDHPDAEFHGTFVPETKPRFGAGAPFKISGL